MNVYLEDAGISQLSNRIKTFEQMLSTEELLNLHIIFKRKLRLFELLLILQKFKRISSLELIIEPQYISPTFIKYINGNKKLGLVFVVKNELNAKSCKKIERCKGIVRIYDYTHQNLELANSRNVLMAYEGVDEIINADIYNLISKENPLYQCVFSSCLGHTIYVASNGDVSFCPKYIDESKIGTMDNIEKIFESEKFYNCLKKSFEHRNKCKNSCQYFNKCKGGCPFEDSCSYFKNNYQLAEEDLIQLEKNETNLSSLPLYKELALLNKLCSKIRYK